MAMDTLRISGDSARAVCVLAQSDAIGKSHRVAEKDLQRCWRPAGR
jgi:hypothetical protein